MLAKLVKDAKTKKREVDRTKPHLSIGTIGHVDAGKSTLSAAIIKLQNSKNLASLEEYNEIDKAPEEKTRGITINIKHVKFETLERHYTLIDCPGHADFLKNMILGASQMDGAILVISNENLEVDKEAKKNKDEDERDKGIIRKQTTEHLRLCNTLGVKNIVVLINEKKALDELEQFLLSDIVKDELIRCNYDPENVPIVHFSALKALNGDKPEVEKLEEFIEIIDKNIPLPVRDSSKPFLMYVESKYQITGHGTVVAGKVEQGILKEGDLIQIVGLNKPKKIAVVKSMEMHGEMIKDYARPGDDVGISLRGVDFKDVQKGQVLGASTLELEPSDYFLVNAYIFSKEEGRRTPFESGYKPQFFVHTANVTGEVILPSGVKIEPDEKKEKLVSFRVKLIFPLYIQARDRFIMRESGKTVGMGFVTRILNSNEEYVGGEDEEYVGNEGFEA